MSQEQLVVTLLQITDMEQLKPVRRTIEETKVAYSADSVALGKDLPAMYRSTVGSLMYIATIKKGI